MTTKWFGGLLGLTAILVAAGSELAVFPGAAAVAMFTVAWLEPKPAAKSNNPG